MVVLPLGQRPGYRDDTKEKPMPMVKEPTSGDRLDRTYDKVFVVLIVLALVVGGLAWMASS